LEGVSALRARQCWTASWVLALGIAVADPAVAAAQTAVPSRAAFAHVRSSDEAVTILMREAAARSATFRAMVEQIDTSDGIVYVEPGACRSGPRACLIAVSAAGVNRLLWVRVQTNRPHWDLMGAVAHELWHALEVLGEPDIRSNSAMHLFYERKGFRVSGSFETREAIRVADRVRREVRRGGGRIESRELASLQ
jgi:hypothetical protein